MKSALTGEAEIAARIRRELQALQRSRAKMNLELISMLGGNPETLATVVEQVREKDIIISQPSSGALTRPLAGGDRVRLCFAASGGISTGEARVLGRIKMQSGGKGMFFGYRVSIPTQMQTVERRQHPRIPFEYGSEPMVHLTSSTDGASEEARASLSGHMQDISIGGAQVRIDGSAPPIKPGARMMLISDFPMPVGSVNHPVTVQRVERDPNTGVTRLGLQFATRIPNLAAFLETLQARRTRRG